MTADPDRSAGRLLAGLVGVSVPFAGLMVSTSEAPFALVGLAGLSVGAVGAIRALDRDRADRALAVEREAYFQAESQGADLLTDAYYADVLCRYCHGWHSADVCPDIAEVAS